jgi:hypothetical protein
LFTFSAFYKPVYRNKQIKSRGKRSLQLVHLLKTLRTRSRVSSAQPVGKI